MFEVTTRPCIDRLPTLQGVGINTGFARAVIEDHVDGRTWVDRVAAPRAAHSLHSYGMSLVWGEEVGKVIDELAAHLREGNYRERDEWLQIDSRWAHLDWDTLLDAESDGGSPSSVQRFNRVNFAFDRSEFQSRHRDLQAPPGCRVRPMTAGEFDLPDVSVVPSAFWRDARQFLAHGGGWCVEYEGAVAAIAFSSFRFDDELEIGVETHPAHRGKGYALAAAVAMIRDALACELTPVWSCRLENAGSVRLARRLGFAESHTGPYFRLPAQEVLPT